LIDTHGRAIEYIRISVTDRCNLRCRYCMPEEGIPLLAHDDILRFEETAALARVAVQEGIRSIRITGGEPLVKRGIVRFVKLLASIDGLEDLAMTTNGVLLGSMASQLREAGLKRVNIGLPSLDPEHYRSITRCDESHNAIAGLHAALDAGLQPVKVNVVVMRGLSDDFALAIELARTLPIELRFIEYMPMGPEASADLFVPAAEIRRKAAEAAAGQLHETESAKGSGPVKTALHAPGWAGTIAVIPAMSEHFCAQCNRLRLTSDGYLRTCLFSDDELDIKPALRPQIDDEALRRLLRDAVTNKPACMPAAARRGRRWMGQVGG
jgi:GTP 3',8-cyclase